MAQLNIERAKSEIFKAEIDGYVAELQAQKNESDLYLAQIEGERAKIDIFKAEVDAYATRVAAVKSSNDVVIAQINADIAEERVNLDAHLANIETYKAKSRNADSQIGFKADIYRTTASVFESALRTAQAGTELNVQSQIRAGVLDQASANMSLQAAIANLNALLESNKIRVTASQSQANSSAALAGMVGSAIQGMLQLGGQGTSIEETSL